MGQLGELVRNTKGEGVEQAWSHSETSIGDHWGHAGGLVGCGKGVGSMHGTQRHLRRCKGTGGTQGRCRWGHRRPMGVWWGTGEHGWTCRQTWKDRCGKVVTCPSPQQDTCRSGETHGRACGNMRETEGFRGQARHDTGGRRNGGHRVGHTGDGRDPQGFSRQVSSPPMGPPCVPVPQPVVGKGT